MIADDHRHSDIHALHNPIIQTPNFDTLARDGTVFTNTHIMGGWHRAVCAPSRACVLTGGAVFHAVANVPEPLFDDVMRNHCDINPKMKVMPEVFRKAGYHTFATGKWHNDKEAFRRGFCGGDELFFGGMSLPYQIPLHRFNPAGEYPPDKTIITKKHATERFADAGVRFIDGYEGDSPFFLYMAFTSPHDPRIAPPKYAEMYPVGNIPLPRNFLPVHPFDNGEMHVRDEGLARLPRESEEVCRHIADYYSMITHMDAEIGRVLDALKRKGIEDRTIVVYTSDHGLAIGQHGLMGKQNLYDHSIKIPLLVRGPNVPKGNRSDSLTCQMDIFPTLCELSGVKIPDTVDGDSLVPLMTRARKAVHESVYSTYKDLQRMVRKGEWKLIRYYRSKVSNTGADRIQLFNMERDPWETENLALSPGHAKQLGELHKELRQWQVRVNDPLLEE